MIWVYLVLLLLGTILVAFLTSNVGKGMIGEFQVGRVLKKLAYKYGGIEFHDFMFEDDKSSSQIDNMLLTQKALYVIEVKNYKGMIFGNEQHLNWTQTVKHVNQKKGKNGKKYYKTNITKHSFYNPVKQNKTHINKIKSLTDIPERIPVVNIVVFGKRAKLKNVTVEAPNYAIHYWEIKKLIDKLESGYTEIMHLNDQIEFVDTLFNINIKDKKRRKKHVKDLKKKYS